MVEGLLGALILIAIVCIIVGVIVELVPMSPPLPRIIWAVAVVICLVILARGLGIAIPGI